MPSSWKVRRCISPKHCSKSPVTCTVECFAQWKCQWMSRYTYNLFRRWHKRKIHVKFMSLRRTPLLNAEFYSDSVVGISVEIFKKCGCHFKMLGTRRMTWSEFHVWSCRTKFSRHGDMTPRFVYPWSRDLFLDIQQAVFRNLKFSNQFWWRLQYSGTLRCVFSLLPMFRRSAPHHFKNPAAPEEFLLWNNSLINE